MRVSLAILLVTTLAAPAIAQGPASAKTKAPQYDPKAEVTLTGTVEDVHESKLRSDHPGLHLMLKTAAASAAESELLEVHVCPVQFMKLLDFTVAKGDTVKVIGSRPAGAAVLVGREITKGQTSLTLRDAKGLPIW
jgi:hypothetical protein